MACKCTSIPIKSVQRKVREKTGRAVYALVILRAQKYFLSIDDGLPADNGEGALNSNDDKGLEGIHIRKRFVRNAA